MYCFSFITQFSRILRSLDLVGPDEESKLHYKDGPFDRDGLENLGI